MIDKETDSIIEAVLDDIRLELHAALSEFPSIRSAHEGVAIIDEEFQEFKSAVYWPHKGGNEEIEATQLAAMCVRYLLDVVIRDAPR